jgi:hypothetical protein
VLIDNVKPDIREYIDVVGKMLMGNVGTEIEQEWLLNAMSTYKYLEQCLNYKDLMVVDAQNVHEFTLRDIGEGGKSKTGLPLNARLPAPLMWIEWSTTNRNLTAGYLTSERFGSPKRSAVLLYELEPEFIINQRNEHMKRNPLAYKAQKDGSYIESAADNLERVDVDMLVSGWDCMSLEWYETPVNGFSHTYVLQYVSRQVVYHDGHIKQVGCIMPPKDAIGQAPTKELFSELYKRTEAHLSIPLQTLSLFHVKGIEFKKVEPNVKLNKNRQKAGKLPLVKYYTMATKPTSLIQSDSNPGSKGDKKALHFVRGNFARYTEERPLFGSIVGTIWRPAHKRGSLDRGVIKKRYRPELSGV